MSDQIGNCPLCGSEGVLHKEDSPLMHDGASCSNPFCILHIGFQDECNKHVLASQWPKAHGLNSRTSGKALTGDYP